MIESLKKLCSINSVAVGDEQDNTYIRVGCTSDAPYGEGPKKALDYMLSLCDSFGFRVKNCGNRLGYAEIGEGEEIFGILVHLDVVPAGNGWDYDPFDLTEVDGKIYGRGSTDDKGPAIAAVYAMKDILDSGVKLKRRIRIIFGQTEETGEWTDMDYYKQTEELPAMGFTPDADFPTIYCEKGILHTEITLKDSEGIFKVLDAGLAVNMVPDFAHAELNDGRVFDETGKSAHGSTPEDGENAISKLMKTLEDAGVDSSFVRFYNSCIGFRLDGSGIGADFSDESSGGLTLNAGTLTLEDGQIKLALDMRCPATIPLEEIAQSISKALAPYGASSRTLHFMDSVFMDKSSDLITKLNNAYYQVTGRNDKPIVMGGGTYARAMSNIVAFGPMIPGRELTEHQKNEYILKEDFLMLREIYRTALLNLNK